MSVVITDTALKPCFAAVLKGNGEIQHDLPGKEQGAGAVFGERIGLILHHAHIGAFGNAGEGVGLRVTVLCDIHCGDGVDFRKGAHGGPGEGVVPTIPLNDIEEGGSVLSLQILLGEQSVGAALGCHRDWHICRMHMRRRGGQHTQNHDEAQQQTEKSGCSFFHNLYLLAEMIIKIHLYYHTIYCKAQ